MNRTFCALSLTQPWASLVAIGAKRIETRSWATSYRGLIAIHAAKGMDAEAREACVENDRICEMLVRQMKIWPRNAAEQLPRGVIIAVAELHDCRRFGRSQPIRGRSDGSMCVDLESGVGSLSVNVTGAEYAFGNYAPGRYGFFLRDIVRLPEPVPCRGALSLWAVPADVEALVSKQMGRSGAAAPPPLHGLFALEGTEA